MVRVVLRVRSQRTPIGPIKYLQFMNTPLGKQPYIRSSSSSSTIIIRMYSTTYYVLYIQYYLIHCNSHDALPISPLYIYIGDFKLVLQDEQPRMEGNLSRWKDILLKDAIPGPRFFIRQRYFTPTWIYRISTLTAIAFSITGNNNIIICKRFL